MRGIAMHRLPLIVLAAAASALAACQLEVPKPSPLIGARSLALSPDGSKLAFSYQGDIWVVPSNGGRAVPLTNNVEMDDNPVWSPDGKWIAFASNRSGNNDIYLVPAEGGQSRRLTWFSGSDVPSDWSPDGKYILERSARDDPNNGIFAIDVRTGRTKQILLDMMPVGSPRYLPNGKILYSRFGFPWFRPRYQGSGAAQLWTYDPASGVRASIRSTGFQNLWPASDGNDVYDITVVEKTPATTLVGQSIGKNVDNVRRTPNVYDIKSGRRITDFVGEGTRFLTAAKATKLVAFERDGTVYTLVPGAKPQPIDIYASIDDKTTQEERLILTGGAVGSDLSPKGDKVAFEVRGELWMVPTKKGKGPNADDAIQLTQWAGIDEEPLWGTDNKSLFFMSDRDGSDRLFRMNTDTKEVTAITKTNDDVSGLKLTPDKKYVSFWLSGENGGLFKVPVEGGTPQLVIPKKGNFAASVGEPYDWSPDMRYVAYSDTLTRSGYYYWDSTNNIFLYDTQTGKSTNLTRLSAVHDTPKFTPDGKYLLMHSNRQGAGIYAIPLREEDVRPAELELKYEKPAAPVKTVIDLEGIETRARRIISQDPNGAIEVDAQNGEIYFVSEGDLWKAAYNGEEVHRLTNGGGVTSFGFSQDGNQIVMTKNGQSQTFEIHKPGVQPVEVKFRADWTHDLRKEREASYAQFWRTYNHGFYDPNFHGRDWDALRETYKKFLPSVGHRNEMATVLNMLVGELESSHSEVSPASGNPSSQTSAHLGFLADYSYEGDGIKIREVPAHTPGAYLKTRLQAGEIVRKINGKPVRLDEALYRDVLNEQVGRELVLTVEGKDGKTREDKYRALSSSEFNGIVWNNLIDVRRKYVEQKSGGKLTYVHIAGMGEGELVHFNQQVWQYAQGKKGLIIDVRNNGGGNTSDRIIDVLERAPNAWYQPRDAEPILSPGQALAMPMVVMMAETSYSNAEMFPASMKARKLATLVGMPTPGYVIYTGGFRLVDGTNARMPGTGAWRLDGTPMEDNGQVPDERVEILPEEFFAGKDPQIDRAIEVLTHQAK